MPKVRITENKLRQIVNESINRILNEGVLGREQTLSNIQNVLNNIELGIENLKRSYFENLTSRECCEILEKGKIFYNLLYYMLKKQRANRKY